MMNPIHTATINGHPVRFFASPFKDGHPDFPWHCVNDLMAALKMDQPTREHFLRSLRSGPNAIVESIPTDTGIIQACPHFMAQGLVDAMVEVKAAPRKSRREYDTAIVDAAEALEKYDSRAGSFEYTIAAFRRWDSKGGAR